MDSKVIGDSGGWKNPRGWWKSYGGLSPQAPYFYAYAFDYKGL